MAERVCTVFLCKRIGKKSGISQHLMIKLNKTVRNISLTKHFLKERKKMILDKILSGESLNVEFKERIPDKSIRYMKTVVAFANGSGGKLIFGVEDGTRKIIGVETEQVFRDMDSIANAISDSCAPEIIPDISLQSAEGKTLIVVEVPEGRHRPYYVKSLGRDEGVYVRVSGTTRPADDFMIRELTIEGSCQHYDQMLCHGLQVTQSDIEKLCRDLKEEAIRNARTPEEKASVREVTLRQLLSWGVVTETGGDIYPTNAYAILTGSDMVPAAIQCGVFKGTTKAVFLDRREYSGPVYEQIEQAFQFVLRNIHLGAEFDGLYRRDVYEIPPEVIRELIINAAVHRSYLDHNNIQVAIYDDRLEVTSPGKLPMGQNLRRMKEGYSRIRNEALAYAFAYMHLIEQWGSGIPRMFRRLQESGLQEPEFIGGDVDLRINIYRKAHFGSGSLSSLHGDSENTIDLKDPEQRDDDLHNKEDDPKTPRNDPEAEKRVSGHIHQAAMSGSEDSFDNLLLILLQDHPESTYKIAAQKLSVSEATVKRTISRLKKMGILTREGSRRNGTWIVNLCSETDE